jgi:hypothetical protein
MGRPLKSVYFGNTTTGGQQIEGYAWTAGDSQARLSHIVKQKTTNSYVMESNDGTGVPGGGQVYLVNGSVTAAGQGNISVLPYGDSGEGATATANLGVLSATVVVSGTGDTTADYAVGDVLKVSGGTYTGNQQANVTVASVQIRTIAANNVGTGYAQGDYFIFSGAGYSTAANVAVATVNGNGNITALSITVSGTYTGSLPTDPVTATSQVSTGGAGATFNIGWGVKTLTVANIGDYPTIPSNPVSLVGGGGGATANLTYRVSSIKVTNGGSGYNEEAPGVTFNPSGATATATVSGGSVTTVAVNTGGSYSAKPQVYLLPNGTGYAAPGYATKITDQIVHTFDGRQFNWLLEGTPLPGPGWAHIKSS